MLLSDCSFLFAYLRIFVLSLLLDIFWYQVFIARHIKQITMFVLVLKKKKRKENWNLSMFSQIHTLRIVEWVVLIRFLFGMGHYKSTLDFAFLF